MIDTSEIPLSRKDSKKGLILPKELTNDLAYICGFLIGDGSLNFRLSKHEYSIKLVGNPKDEKEFYDIIISKLFKKIFNLDVKPKYHDGGGTYGITIFSKTLFRFLTEKANIPFGKKSHIVSIPKIFRISESLLLSFIQGFADADFCLTLKKRYKKYNYYPSIEGSSASEIIIDEISEIIEKIGFKFSKSKITYFDERVKKHITTYRIDVNGHFQLVKWMKFIGFRNQKYIKKFELWKEINKENKRAQKAFDLLRH